MAKLIGYTLATLILSGIFCWYNYIWWATSIPFLALLLIAALAIWVVQEQKPIGVLFGCLFFVSFALQILKWFSVVSFPIFK